MTTIRTARRRSTILLAGLTLAGLAASIPSVARAGGVAPVAAAQAASSDWDALFAAAAASGAVPVIVELDVKATPEGRLNAAEQHAQRARITKFRDGMLRADFGTKVPKALKVSDSMPLVALHADRADLDALRRSPRVVRVVLDAEVTVDDLGLDTSTSGAPGVTATSAFGNAGGVQITKWWDLTRVRADVANANGWNGTGQTIAVLDTGVDRNHAWLAGRVVAEACFSTTVIGSTVGGCPNGRSTQTGIGAAAPCTYSYTCAHGTHVAHTAAGTYGVARGARIIAVQVFHRRATDGKPTYFESDILWGLDYVYRLRTTYRIAAVNMSLGGFKYSNACDGTSDGSTPYLSGWFNSLKSVGIAPVVASGNDGWSNAVGRPACFNSAVTVGNTTLYGNVDYINTSSNGLLPTSNIRIDMLAPGTDICSAVPTFLDTDGVVDGVQCDYVGTSMAAPHIAGAIAILRQKRPAATVDQVVNAMRASGPLVYDTRNGVSTPRLDVWAALARI